MKYAGVLADTGPLTPKTSPATILTENLSS